MTGRLKFSEKAHRYWFNGRPIPGVTTILNKAVPKPGLQYWSARSVAEYVMDNPEGVEALRSMGRNSAVAALKQVPWTERDTAAARGTEVHRLGEAVVHGREVEVPEHLLGYVEGYARLIDDIGLEPVLTEKQVCHEDLFYAGTFDLIATVGGEPWMLDLKTSKEIYGSVSLQVAAYANADWYQDDDGEHPMPEVAGLGAIHVTDAGSRLHRFPDPVAAWKVWRHVRWLADQIPVVDGWGTSEKRAS